MAVFNQHLNAAHDATANLFGEVARCTVLGVDYSYQVNFNRPSKDDRLGGLHPSEWEFTTADTWIEYREPQFPNLFEQVAAGVKIIITITESVSGDTIGVFRATKAAKFWDGKTIKVKIEEVRP